MPLFKMILVFAPWLAFLVIAQGSLVRLKVGLVIGLILCIVLGIARIHRGVILWAGLIFFSFATIVVVFFENMWTIHYMGVFASGFLAVSTWWGVCLGKPFTLDYAREQVDPSLWADRGFIKSNYIITSVWGVAFTINAFLAVGKAEHFAISELSYEIISYALLIGTVIVTSRYTKMVRARRVAASSR
jgi:hypothetical protein